MNKRTNCVFYKVGYVRVFPQPLKANISSNQKKTICWSHSATPDNQTSQSCLRMDTRKWQEEGRKTKEDMARHTERRFGHIGC